MTEPLADINTDTLNYVVPFYEENRFVFTGDKESFQVGLDKKIDDILSKAPVVLDEYEESHQEEAGHSLILRYPEDSHIIPFVEKAMFNKLSDKQKQLAGTNREIYDWTLMEFDPRLPNLEMEVDDSQIIRAESLFEHEVEHARAAHAAGQKIVYIVIPFVWQKIEGGKERLKTVHATTLVSSDLGPGAGVDVATAPRFASHEDLMNARYILKELDEPLHPLWEKLHKYETGLPKLDGHGLKHDEMIELFLDKWRETRNSTESSAV